MKNTLKITTLATFVALSHNVLADAITDTFNDGDALTAATLNNIKTAVNGNDAQLTTNGNAITTNSSDITAINAELLTVTTQLQEVSENQQREVAINCDNDADNFINTTISNDTTYTLTGTCNGPIEINGRANITIKGDDTGVKDDGISLAPNVISAFGSSLSVNRTQNLILDNLTITAYNSLSSSANAITNGIDTLSINKGSSASMYNVTVSGGDTGIGSRDAASLRIYEGNIVENFLDTGIAAGRNSVIGIRSTISVIGGITPTPTSIPKVLVANKNATIRVKDTGHVFTPSPSANGYDGFSLYAVQNGVIDIRNATLNGNAVAESGGQININSSDIDGEMYAKGNSVINISNTSINDDISTETSSSIIINNNSTVESFLEAESNSHISMNNSSLNGGVGASGNSSINLENITQINGSFDINSGSALGLYNSTISYDATNFEIQYGANVTIDNTSITGTASAINIRNFGTLKFTGAASNMNGVDITCQYPEQYNDNGITLNNLGTVTCP